MDGRRFWMCSHRASTSLALKSSLGEARSAGTGRKAQVDRAVQTDPCIVRLRHSQPVKSAQLTVGVDVSLGAARAVEWAVGEASRRGCGVRLVHVADTADDDVCA